MERLPDFADVVAAARRLGPHLTATPFYPSASLSQRLPLSPEFGLRLQSARR